MPFAHSSRRRPMIQKKVEWKVVLKGKLEQDEQIFVGTSCLETCIPDHYIGKYAKVTVEIYTDEKADG